MTENKATKTEVVDASSISSPYYLHQPLIENNYPTWSRAMTTALSARNKFGFIDGTVDKPGTDSVNFKSWQRCNTTVLSWIWNSVSKELISSVIYLEMAKEVWDDLKERYAPNNSIQMYQIKRALSMHTQNDLSVSAYYTILKGYWDKLGSLICLSPCACGVCRTYMHLQQQEKVFQFLMGLNESYATVRSQVLTMDPLPSVNKIYSLALQEEKQCNLCIVATQPLEAVAMATSVKEIEQQVSGRGREGRGRGEKPRCDLCGFIGHVRQNCYKLRGYPNRSGTQEKPMSVANVTTNEAVPTTHVTFEYW